jgi:hypothetical protein
MVTQFVEKKIFYHKFLFFYFLLSNCNKTLVFLGEGVIKFMPVG